MCPITVVCENKTKQILYAYYIMPLYLKCNSSSLFSMQNLINDKQLKRFSAIVRKYIFLFFNISNDLYDATTTAMLSINKCTYIRVHYIMFM